MSVKGDPARRFPLTRHQYRSKGFDKTFSNISAFFGAEGYYQTECLNILEMNSNKRPFLLKCTFPCTHSVTKTDPDRPGYTRMVELRSVKYVSLIVHQATASEYFISYMHRIFSDLTRIKFILMASVCVLSVMWTDNMILKWKAMGTSKQLCTLITMTS